MDESVTVRTKNQLQVAYDAGMSEIVAEGELAKRLWVGRKVRHVGRWALMALGIALAATPFTGGLSLTLAAPIAAITGVEIAVIVAVSFVGLALLIAILKEYEIVCVCLDPQEPRLKLKKSA